MPPILTFSTGSLYTYDLDRCVELAAEAGFDGLEIMVDERPATHDPAQLAALSERHALPIRSLHAPFPGRAIPGWDRAPVASITQTVELAEAVGAEHIVMHTPDRVRTRKLPISIRGQRIKYPWGAPLSAAIRGWMKRGGLQRLQTATPVKICVENMPTQYDILRQIIPGLNQQSLHYWNTLETWPQAHTFLTLDTTHWATHGIMPLDAYRAGGERVQHIHLSNFYNAQEHHLPQHGDLDLAEFLRTLAADNYSGHVVVEVKPPILEAGDDDRVRANLAETVAFCREALAR